MANNNPALNSDFRSSLSIMNFNQKPIKKRSTKFFKKIDPNYYPSSGSASSSTPMPCSECGKKFSSRKALYGHMRCHPERTWRGINPPPNFRPNDTKLLMTEEDHEVALCLLILANATCDTSYNNYRQDDGLNCRFECSCCKKVFGSHQALGGHRATHKNVKGCCAMEDYYYHGSIHHGGGIGLQKASGTRSGTLGGHKRCHWEYSPPPSAVKTTKHGCSLDLNLPARDHGDPPGLTLDLRLGL